MAADQDEDAEIRLDTSKDDNKQSSELNTLKTEKPIDTLLKENEERQDDFLNKCEDDNVDCLKNFNEKSQFIQMEDEDREDQNNNKNPTTIDMLNDNETNDEVVPSDDYNNEERFRVDRKQLENLLKGRYTYITLIIYILLFIVKIIIIIIIIR